MLHLEEGCCVEAVAEVDHENLTYSLAEARVLSVKPGSSSDREVIISYSEYRPLPDVPLVATRPGPGALAQPSLGLRHICGTLTHTSQTRRQRPGSRS